MNLDDSNTILRQFYQENLNYKIVINNSANRNCIIFFSGNGLYYPNTVDVFQEKIVEQDRYEWEHVSESKVMSENFSMMIFVRDIYKTFYVKGINQTLSTIDDVLAFLKEKTMGYQIVTCGNSAGGYMAVIAGHHLSAKRIYSFGGQWKIETRGGYFYRSMHLQKGIENIIILRNWLIKIFVGFIPL